MKTPSEKLYESLVNSSYHTEEDVRVHCESVFFDFFQSLGIKYDASYEVKIATGAVDSLYNNLCLEYKRPGLLKGHFDKFVKEKIKYISGLAQRYHTQEDQIVGVLLDGVQIGFFRKNAEGALIAQGPFDLSPQVLDHFIHLVQSFHRKALISDHLIADLGEKSPTARYLVSALWSTFITDEGIRTKMFFQEWAKMFGQVSDFGSGKESVIQEALNYGIKLKVDEVSKFIFVLHSTYAIYIKLISLMIMRFIRNALSAEPFPEAIQQPDLQSFAEELESGNEFVRLGVRNFLEGDFFCWYTQHWNPQLNKAFKHLCHILNFYEPSSVILKPEVIHDLLKGLYQGLMSKSMRHNLGEYYTPDWLAEFTINKSGWTPEQTILDPTCGSGTFLIQLINKSKNYLIEQHYTNKEAAEHILSHVYGFDLNPLAVISARTNYLIALSPLMDGVGEIDIPVYLTDSIFPPQREGDHFTYHLDTQEGILHLSFPQTLFERGIFNAVINQIDHLAHLSVGDHPAITEQQAVQALKQWGLPTNDEQQLFNLLCQMRLLEAKEWDGIWCNIIKNHFTASALQDFDVIIGNPPWLRWSVLPPSYRETIKSYCRDLKLFSSDTFYGGIESDVSTIVLYSAARKWLRKGGRLAMLITRSIFKNESSEGFRSFTLDDTQNDYLHVDAVHDFTLLKPFQNAANKAALLILTRGPEKTTYPLPWTEWAKTAKFTEHTTLSNIFNSIASRSLIAYPLKKDTGPWLTMKEEELEDCLVMAQDDQEKRYAARKGVCTDMNGIYYGQIKGQRDQFVLFENNPSLGRKKVQATQHLIEKDLVFPIARGRDISPFSWKSDRNLFGIIPQNSMKGYPIDLMLSSYPQTLNFFNLYRADLEQRSSLKRYLSDAPFYSCWNVGSYTFSPYKVCWSEISGQFKACVLSNHEGHIIIPDHKIYFIPTETEEEAHFLCGFLNAHSVEDFILGYAENTQIGTHITDYLHIPTFNPANSFHRALMQVSIDATQGKMAIEVARNKADRLIHKIFKKHS